jgi:heptosyltransferase-2
LTSDPATIVIVAPNWLGDAVMALPAIADVRRQFRSATLRVAARPAVAALFEMVPGIDAVVDAASIAGVNVPPSAGAGLQPRPTTVGILLPNSFGSAWRLKRAGVAERWGYATDWRSPLLTRAVRRPRASLHQGRYYQHLIAGLGIATGPLEPDVRVPDAARRRARDLLVAAGWDEQQRLVTLAPGAAYGTAKRWLPRHFADLIGSLGREYGARAVIVGSAADVETTRLIAADLGHATPGPIDLTGRTTLQELAAVLSLSAACVSNDSGAMHLAGAIGTPVVALFGPTRETETAPLTRRGGRADVLINPVWCRPCMLRECPIDHRCMRGLAPSRVLATLRELVS